MSSIGETKQVILRSCMEPKRWTDLKTITGIADPTLMVHVNDLQSKNLLGKTDEGTYETTDKGIELLQLVPHARVPPPKGKMSYEVFKMIQKGIKLGHLSLRETLEFIFTPELSISFRLDKSLAQLYNDVGLAIRNSVIMWLPEGLEPDKAVYRAVNQLIAKQIKLAKNDEQKGRLHMVIDFDLPMALDYIIREEKDENVKKKLIENREQILEKLYKNWDKIFK